MRLPFIESRSKIKYQDITAFAGINTSEATSENEFHDLKNVSLDDFPVLKLRPALGEFLNNPPDIRRSAYGISVDGNGSVFSGAQKIGDIPQKNGQFTMVKMGAYLVFFPSKVCINLSIKPHVILPLEKAYSQFAPIAFQSPFAGSVFTKIISPGINQYFNRYDAIEISGCQNPNYNSVKTISEVGDNFIVVTGVLNGDFTQQSGLVFARKVPDMDFVCEADNRLWGCSSAKHEIYASKLGDPFNWRSFEGISTDSFAATLGSSNVFTGCVKYLRHVLFFNKDRIFKVYGDRPSNFQVIESPHPGVDDNAFESISIIRDTLYYKGFDGIYSYDGSYPELISEKVEGFSNSLKGHAVKSATLDGNYYLFSGGRCLIYYPQRGAWSFSDYGDIDIYSAFADTGVNSIDLLTNKGKALLRSPSAGQSGENVNSIPWVIESVWMGKEDLGAKYISKLLIGVQLGKDSYVDIFVRHDGEPIWDKICTVASTRDEVRYIPIVPQRHRKFAFRLEGKGFFKLTGIRKSIEGGSDIIGNI